MALLRNAELEKPGAKNATPRYLRLCPLDFQVLAKSGTYAIDPAVTLDFSTIFGAPWVWSAASATSLTLGAKIRLPRTASFGKMWAVVKTPGIMTTKDTLDFVIQNPSASVAHVSTPITHTNSVASLVGGTDISGSSNAQYYDSAGADPSSITALVTYLLTYKWQYDSDAGGTQTTYLYGGILKYTYADDSELGEPT